MKELNGFFTTQALLIEIRDQFHFVVRLCGCANAQ
jgi:hypothetical protein